MIKSYIRTECASIQFLDPPNISGTLSDSLTHNDIMVDVGLRVNGRVALVHGEGVRAIVHDGTKIIVGPLGVHFSAGSLDEVMLML